MLISANNKRILILMSSGLTEKNNTEETELHSNRNAAEGSSGTDTSRKTVDLVNSLEVQVMKEEGGNDLLMLTLKILMRGSSIV